MSEFKGYPKTGQFRQVVRDVVSGARFKGMDDNGEAIIDHSAPLPKLTFCGKVKIHGTHAAVSYNPNTEEIWVQSRKNIITPTQDNAGFAYFVEARKELLLGLFREIQYSDVPTPSLDDTITVYGEFFGGNIQKGVAVTDLDRAFAIFSVKCGEEWVRNPSPYEGIGGLNANRIFMCSQFGEYFLSIDFANPEASTPKLVDITMKVEEECPVGKFFGVEGVGEGVVWTAFHEGQKYIFKVKGEKHVITCGGRIKKLKVAISPEKMESIQEFVGYAVTEGRLAQAIENVFTMEGKEPDVKGMGAFLKWMMTDILAEEVDVMVENGLEPKEIGKFVSNKAKTWFFENYK